jgi:hypothetical protein
MFQISRTRGDSNNTYASRVNFAKLNIDWQNNQQATFFHVL